MWMHHKAVSTDPLREDSKRKGQLNVNAKTVHSIKTCHQRPGRVRLHWAKTNVKAKILFAYIYYRNIWRRLHYRILFYSLWIWMRVQSQNNDFFALVCEFLIRNFFKKSICGMYRFFFAFILAECEQTLNIHVFLSNLCEWNLNLHSHWIKTMQNWSLFKIDFHCDK